MAIVSISEAAKLVRKGRQTLYNHNDKGKLSFTKTEAGKPGVDTSELERVYGKLYISADKVNTVATDTASHSDNSRQTDFRNNSVNSRADTGASKSASIDVDTVSTLNWFIEQVDDTKKELADTKARLVEREATLAELRAAIAVLPSPESVERRLADQANCLRRQHDEKINVEREQLAQVLAEQKQQAESQHKQWQQDIADRQAEIQQARAEADELRQRHAEQEKTLNTERARAVALESRGFFARLLNKKPLPQG